jgi:hypothetical protein
LKDTLGLFKVPLFRGGLAGFGEEDEEAEDVEVDVDVGVDFVCFRPAPETGIIFFEDLSDTFNFCPGRRPCGGFFA